MSRAKVGHFHDGKFHELASGSEEYCRGFFDGYNLYSDVVAVILVGDHCQCGPDDRREYVDDRDFVFPRTGCLRCGRWDSPVRHKK